MSYLCNFEINGHKVEFINSSRNTRAGFAHDTKIYIDGYNSGGASCYYYNRTWERYTYQSVMLSAVSGLLSARCDDLIAAYKADHNIKRLTAARRETVIDSASGDSQYKLYDAIRAHLLNNLCYSY